MSLKVEIFFTDSIPKYEYTLPAGLDVKIVPVLDSEGKLIDPGFTIAGTEVGGIITRSNQETEVRNNQTKEVVQIKRRFVFTAIADLIYR